MPLGGTVTAGRLHGDGRPQHEMSMKKEPGCPSDVPQDAGCLPFSCRYLTGGQAWSAYIPCSCSVGRSHAGCCTAGSGVGWEPGMAGWVLVLAVLAHCVLVLVWWALACLQADRQTQAALLQAQELVE